MYTLILLLTQPSYECTLIGQGSRVYPNGRGSRVYPNGWGSRVRPGRGRRCARASPSQLALRARGSRYALAARASPSQLARSRLVCTDLEKTNKETLYEFVLYNSYRNCMILYEFVQKPMNSYVSMCIQIKTYELGCTNCVVRIRIIKKKTNKNSHGIPTHALITSELHTTS